MNFFIKPPIMDNFVVMIFLPLLSLFEKMRVESEKNARAKRLFF